MIVTTSAISNPPQNDVARHNNKGNKLKSVAVLSTMNAQNWSKQIIGQRIDIQILPKRILI